MKVQAYLNFEGRCDEALDHYREALGAEVLMLMRFKDNPEPRPGCEGLGDKVMHCAFRVGESVVMASDMGPGGKPMFQGFSLSLEVADESDAERRFAALAAGGRVHVPLNKTFFARRFGVVADRFGVSWMVMAPA